jgi:hypothetical protein
MVVDRKTLIAMLHLAGGTTVIASKEVVDEIIKLDVFTNIKIERLGDKLSVSSNNEFVNKYNFLIK